MMNSLPSQAATHDLWLPPMQQRLFRDLLHGFSYPGQIASSPETGPMTWLALLAALCDGEVSLADPHDLIPAHLWPMLEARRETPERATFIVADGGRPMAFQPCAGTLESPEAGATLLLCVAELGGSAPGAIRLELTGPGVRDLTELAVSGLHPSWLRAREAWGLDFPLGFDLVLCDPCRFAALPRTTHIEVQEKS